MKIITKEEKNTLAVRLNTSLTDLPKNLGEIYGEIGEMFASEKAVCSGSPFVIYYNMDMSNLDIEAGFPAVTTGEPAGRLKKSILPGGDQATALHIGPYDNLEESYTKLTTFVKEQSRETLDYMYEEYLNSPGDCPPDKLETRIYFILK